MHAPSMVRLADSGVVVADVHWRPPAGVASGPLPVTVTTSGTGGSALRRVLLTRDERLPGSLRAPCRPPRAEKHRRVRQRHAGAIEQVIGSLAGRGGDLVRWAGWGRR